MTTIAVRGGATAEELAAVLAALARPAAVSGPSAAVDGYTAWRRVRLAAVREETRPTR